MAALRVLLVATLLAVPFWIARSSPAHACSCVGGSVRERASAADLIVIGSPTNMRLLGPVPTPEPLSQPGVGRVDSNGPPAAVDINVHEYIKGTGPATLTVYESGTTITVSPDLQVEVGPRSSAACGTFDDLSVRYLLFLYRQPEGLSSGGVCGGSTAITDYNGTESYIAEVREAVVAGPIVLPRNGSGPAHHAPAVAPLAAASVLATAALAMNAWLALRHR